MCTDDHCMHWWTMFAVFITLFLCLSHFHSVRALEFKFIALLLPSFLRLRLRFALAPARTFSAGSISLNCSDAAMYSMPRKKTFEWLLRWLPQILNGRNYENRKKSSVFLRLDCLYSHRNWNSKFSLFCQFLLDEKISHIKQGNLFSLSVAFLSLRSLISEF